jgi:large subunit ribosomal protein L21
LNIYAIVETGGKQYRVSSGQIIEVEKLGVLEGENVELNRVLLIADGDKVTLGTPTIEGAKVMATSKGDDRADKIIVYKYKNKTRYSKKTGHKQPFTRLSIDQIIGSGAEAGGTAQAEPAKRVRRRKSEVTESGS